MPLTELYIEQTAVDRWVGRVEIGGISHHVVQVRANSFAEVMTALANAYYERRPDERLQASAEIFGVVDAMAQAVKAHCEDRPSIAPAKPKRTMSEETKRKMTEGRQRRHARLRRQKEARARAVADEGPDAA